MQQPVMKKLTKDWGRLGMQGVLWLVLLTAMLNAQPPFYPSSRQGATYMFNFYLPPPTSSTPWAPTWSPDGKWIAVGMSGSIWKVDVGTGAASELTSDRKYHSSAAWSPDGKWIAYTADDGGQTIQLEILNLESGETRPLTDDSFLYTDPVFSPDGSRLAYVSDRPNGYFNVFIRPIRDGKWNGEEIAVSRDHRYPNDRLYFGPWDMHLSPAWFPDGKELLLLSNRGVPLGSGNVVRVPALHEGMEQARPVLVEQTLYRTRPDVSIDGKRFVYSSTRGAADQFNNLYVQPTDGGTPYKLTFFSHDAFHPRWSPDGEWIAYICNREGLPQLELLETYGGKIKRLAVVERHWKRAVGTLSVQVREAASRNLTPARVHLTASDGKFYAPDSTYARIGLMGDNVFHTTGRFALELPAGKVELKAVKGFEFAPKEAVEAEIRPGKVTLLTIELERMTDLSARGWHSGSTHVHMNYGGNLHNTLENLMRMSAAEDQDVVNLQIANKDNRILDHQFFIPGGGPHPLSTKDRLLVVGQEYRPPFYGHVFMFGMKEHLISPFTTGYEGTAIESLYPSNTDMFRKAREQGATVGYVHAFSGDEDPLQGDLGGAKAFMVDAALGTTDALEWSEASRAGFFPLYAVWNNGLKVSAVGGEDSISDLHRSKLIGSVRTYAFTGGRGLEMKAWFEALKAGQTFVTTGPLVDFTVEGSRPGETIRLPREGSSLTLRVRVQSLVPLEKLLLVFKGEVVEEWPFAEGLTGMEIERSLAVTESGWYHVRVEGRPEERFPLDAGYAQAFTNPVWVTVGNQPIRSVAAAEYSLRWIDKLQKMAGEWPHWRSQQEKDHVFAQFEQAKKVYLSRKSEIR